jgi:acetyl-CoA carboxylase carboxyltransferase component
MMLQRLGEVETALETARGGGGERHVTRHHARGKLLPRERIELLVDQDAPFLELSPMAAWGTDFTVGASVVTGIGIVEGVECLVVAHDPTVRAGVVNPYTLRKIQRATQIALTNRLPLVSLVESAGLDLATQVETFVPGGSVLRDLARLRAARIATISVVFGDATGTGAYLPAGSDYTIMVRNQAKVFLAGPPAIRLTTGERTDDESLGGAGMHACVSGLADFLAEDDRDGLRVARQCVRRLHHRKLGPPPRTATPAPPRHDPDELLSVAGADPEVPVDPREVLARILDGSEFDEFKPAYGTGLVTGWGELHGYPIAVVANARPELSPHEVGKATHFLRLADAARTPVLFLQHTTGFAAGTDQAQAGIIAQGGQLISALVTSTVPHLSLTIGASYGVGSYAMCGRAFEPRFLFTWPNARSAVGTASQLAGPPLDEADGAVRATLEQRLESESGALFLSGRLFDDGVIDPRDTRTVLGICLSAVHSNTVGHADRIGPGAAVDHRHAVGAAAPGC